MKNVMLATLFTFGLSAFAQDGAAPATPPTDQPAASTPAPADHAAHAAHAKKEMKAKKKAPKKKATEGK